MRKNLKKGLAVVLAGTMMLSLMACGKSNNGGSPTKAPSDATEEPVKEGDPTEAPSDATEEPQEETYDFGGVTVKVFAGGVDKLKLIGAGDIVGDEAVKAINEKYNINIERVELEGVDGGNEAELLLSSVTAGDPAAHIVALNTSSLMPAIKSDILFEITDYLDMYQVGSPYTDAVTWQGKCYGISYDNLGDAWTLVYDRKLLKEIGMEKTPTEMFMEGKWDYQSFKEYLVEMKSKLPDDVYPIGQYPFHWGTMASAANGKLLFDSTGSLNFTDEAVVEATEFYQELMRDGLAHPAEEVVKEDASIGYQFAYEIENEKIVLKRAEPWQLGSIGFEYGITYWPWGNNVSVNGDYTTLSDEYQVSIPYWGCVNVLKAASDATGIPGEVLTKIAQDLMNELGSNDFMHDYWVAEQNGETNIPMGAAFGEARNFYTEEDIALFDWAHNRAKMDWSWCMTDAEMIDCWAPFREIFGGNKDARSTLQSYQNSGEANLKDAGWSN